MPVGARTASESSPGTQPAGLRRELSFSGALALSIGIMAPTAALALNGSGVAANAGRAVPLIFLLAAIGVGFVSYAFIRMSRYVSHAGSMFGFTGVALGPRAGLGVGWTLVGTYVMLAATGCAGAAVFALDLFDQLGILGGVGWVPLVVIMYLLVGVIAYGQLKTATRVLLAAEGISIALVVLLIAVIYVKLFAGSAPHGGGFSLKPFSPADGVPTSALFLGIVFAFLSFAGFEGAATLGEETNDPKRNIGRAIGGTLIIGGVLFVLGMLAETLAFGIDEAGVAAFAGSSAPLGDLAGGYIGEWYRVVIDLGATLSMFAAALGGTSAAARMVFVLARDGVGPDALGTTSPKTGSPLAAVLLCAAFGLAVLLFIGIRGASATEAFFYPATVGTLGLLSAYIVTNIGAFRFLILQRRAPAWEGIFPVGATLFLAYVLFKQVHPVPDHPYNLFPYVVLAWIVVGCLYLFTRSSVVDRMREDMAGLQSGAGSVAAGPYIHAGEVDVPGPLSATERADADVL
jgi:amino acid transporter